MINFMKGRNPAKDIDRGGNRARKNVREDWVMEERK